MNIKHTFYIYPLVLLTACSTPKNTTTNLSPALPSTFTGSTDTSTVANTPARQFFSDSNLVRLIDIAIQNNPDMQIALQRVIAARANIQYAKAALAPQVNIVAIGGVEKYGDYTMNGVGNFDTNFSDNISKDQHIPKPTTDLFLDCEAAGKSTSGGSYNNARRRHLPVYWLQKKANSGQPRNSRPPLPGCISSCRRRTTI